MPSHLDAGDGPRLLPSVDDGGSSACPDASEVAKIVPGAAPDQPDLSGKPPLSSAQAESKASPEQPARHRILGKLHNFLKAREVPAISPPSAKAQDGKITAKSEAPDAPITIIDEGPADEHVAEVAGVEKKAAEDLTTPVKDAPAGGKEAKSSTKWPQAAPKSARKSLALARKPMRRRALVIEDVPREAGTHTKVFYSQTQKKWAFVFRKEGCRPIFMQATVAAAGDSIEDAGRIARHCYLKVKNGSTKEEALQYREELYERCRQERLLQAEAQAAKDTSASEEPSAKKRGRPKKFDSQEIVCRDLFGNRVVVPGTAKAEKQAPRPWSQMEPSELEHLTTEEVLHYEKELGLSFRRTRRERVLRLEKLGQRNTLNVKFRRPRRRLKAGEKRDKRAKLGVARQLAKRNPVIRSQSLQEFLERPQDDRLNATTTELKRLERSAFIADGEHLSLAERKSRLQEHLWQTKVETAVKEEAVQASASFFAGWKGTWRSSEGAVVVDNDGPEEEEEKV